ncbi:MAG TPA: hypothetical protein VGN98_08760, partial [Tianweitania sediminis]|nr:hypothetical protein [Tianweitania sediminis]
MAQSALYLLTAVDVRRISQPDSSRAITIATLTMPSLTLMTASQNAGGGVGEVNYTLPRIEAPEPAF